MTDTITIPIKDQPTELTILEAVQLRNLLTAQINEAQAPVAKAVNFFEKDKNESS